jgi:hypothetical protein
MKQFIYLVVVPAFIAAILFATAEYIDNHTFFKIQVGVAWTIVAYIVILLGIHFWRQEGWVNRLFQKWFKK